MDSISVSLYLLLPFRTLFNISDLIFSPVLLRFLDVGSGLGKPNMHFQQRFGAQLSTGVEISKDRYQVSKINICTSQIISPFFLCLHLTNYIVQLSLFNLSRLRETTHLYSNGINFMNGDVLKCDNFDPHTIIHMCDCAFSPEDFYGIAEIFNRRYLIFIMKIILSIHLTINHLFVYRSFCCPASMQGS